MPDLGTPTVLLPVSLGGPEEEIQLAEGSSRVIKTEVVAWDRVVCFKWWKATGDDQQAIDMLAAFGDESDMGWLRSEFGVRGAWDAFAELQGMADTHEPVTEQTLRDLLDRLHRKCGP